MAQATDETTAAPKADAPTNDATTEQTGDATPNDAVTDDAPVNNEAKDEEKAPANAAPNDVSSNNDDAGSKVANFSGNWESFKIENAEQFLIDSGASWLFRKFAALMMTKTIYQTIKQNGDEFEINIQVMGKKQSLKFVVDGFKTEYEFKNIKGDTVKARYSWNDDKTKLLIKNENVTQKIGGDAERYLFDDETHGKITITTIKNKKGTVMKQYWKKSK